VNPASLFGPFFSLSKIDLKIAVEKSHLKFDPALLSNDSYFGLLYVQCMDFMHIYLHVCMYIYEVLALTVKIIVRS
jgi:hypothetical protein